MLYNRLYQPSQKVDSLNFGPWSERKGLNELRKIDFAEISSLSLPAVSLLFFVGGKFEIPVAQRSKEYDQEAFFHIKIRQTWKGGENQFILRQTGCFDLPFQRRSLHSL